VLQSEPGAETVEAILPRAIASTVNVSEVIGKLRDRGMSEDAANTAMALLSLDVRPFTDAQARMAGHLRPATRSAGLSLGDRCCLALAIELGAAAYTTERVWAALEIDGADIIQLR
jgi:ribonuclease VapC